MPYVTKPKPSLADKKLTKVENLSLTRRVALENKVNCNIDILMALIMKKYNLFNGELQSDLALTIILCARILAGIHTDISSCISLLQNMNFVSWSKTSINTHLQNISNSILRKVFTICNESTKFNKQDIVSMKPSIDSLIKKVNEQKFQIGTPSFNRKEDQKAEDKVSA